MDTEAIISGRCAYPKTDMLAAPADLRNHPSFERDEEAQKALGPVLAVYIWRGVVEVHLPAIPYL